MPESLELGSREWLPVAVALASLGALAVLWSLYRSPVRGWAIWLATLCKLVAIASVALYLVEPLLRSTRPKPGANSLAVVVDNSRSMSIRASGQSNSLEHKLRSVLQRDARWHTRAAQDFSLRMYSFDSRLHAVDTFDQIGFDGNSSSLGGAIDTLRERYADRPSAGILIFTDGMSTDTLPIHVSQAADHKLPIFPIVDLGRDQLRDISVSDPTVTQIAFELAPVQVEATLQCLGLKDQAINVRLINEEGKSVQEQLLRADSDSFQKRVRFQYRPTEPGIQFVSLHARLKSEDDLENPTTTSQSEVTLANNTRLLAIDRGGGPYRILYMAGRTSWDFKFFKRAVEEDQELRLAGLIRIAKKEAKFNFRDRSVDTSNPLFAGFEEDQEATEKYDEPILLRIGVRDEFELKGGFPKTEEDLYQFDAIVLDDIEASFFSQEQMLLIRQFVSSRGGGLLMLGGSESFERGGYRDTPIGDLLPVYLRNVMTSARVDDSPLTQSDAAGVDRTSVTFRLTREGGLEPWMRLRANEADEAKRLSEMPRFSAWNRVKEVKPGASVFGVISGEGVDTIPAMIVQNFGSGRVGALTIGDMWRWTMRRSDEETNDLAQCWRQLARWLTADVPKRLVVEVQAPTDTTQPHAITIRARDEKFHPLDNAVFEVVVMPPDGKLVAIDVVADREQPGVYRAQFWSQSDGPYLLSVKASAADDTPVGEVETGWSAEPSALEFRNLIPNHSELAALAKESGGELIDIDDLEQFISSLPTRQVPITETRVEPLWHRTSWLVLTVACLCAEWGLRRWRGLP